MPLLQLLKTLFTTAGVPGIVGGLSGLVIGLAISPENATIFASIGCFAGLAWPFIRDANKK